MSKGKIKRIDDNKGKKVCFWAFLFIFLFSVFSYGFLVQGAIMDIVARQDMENEFSTLYSKVVDLEAQYIKAKNSVTMEKAYELGFVSATNTNYVVRSVENPGLSLVTTDL